MPSLSRKNSAPPSIRISREEDDQWINFEDISKSQPMPMVNLSHGLCASCYQHMDALVDVRSPTLTLNSARRPIPKAVSAPLLTTSTHDLPPLPSMRVLVVDDNKLQRLVHKRMVEQAGFQCDIALSGAQAVEMAREHSYSLILMDLMMEGIDGWTTSKLIRKALLPKVGHTGLPRIVAVTGMQIDTKLIDECADAGMADIVQKPVSATSLNRLLSNCAGESA